MGFETYLKEQIEKHTSMQSQDIIKLCYQAAYGAEHLLSDLDRARDYLEQEYAAIEPKDIELYECISDQVCRVNLAAWKAGEYPLEQLFSMFVDSAQVHSDSKERFLDYLQIAENLVLQGQTGFSYVDWQSYVEEYKKQGMPAVHHSPQYREMEQPAYRIVERQFLTSIMNEI